MTATRWIVLHQSEANQEEAALLWAQLTGEEEWKVLQIPGNVTQISPGDLVLTFGKIPGDKITEGRVMRLPSLQNLKLGETETRKQTVEKLRGLNPELDAADIDKIFRVNTGNITVGTGNSEVVLTQEEVGILFQLKELLQVEKVEVIKK